jgi:hypothetical protein
VFGGVGVVRRIRWRRRDVDSKVVRGAEERKNRAQSQNIQQKAVVPLVQLRESSLFVRGSNHWCLSNRRDLWLAVPEPGPGGAKAEQKSIRCIS